MEHMNDEELDVFVRTEFEALLYEEDSDDDKINDPAVSKAQPQNSTKPISGNLSNSRIAACSRTTSEEDEENIILAMIWQNERLGAAYYNITMSELFVMDDVIDDLSFGIAKALFKQIQPNSLITIGGQSADFLETMKLLCFAGSLLYTSTEASTSTENNYDSSACYFKLLIKSENSFESCFYRVQSLKLEGEPQNATCDERNTYLSSIINFNSRSMIYALGLLLKYIDREWHKISFRNIEQAIFNNISSISLDNLLMIDEDTYKALNIINKRDHPSSFKFGNDRVKSHTISLYSLMNNCQSRLGSQALWKILHHPTTDIEILEKRHQVINFFLNPTNKSVVDSLKTCLKRINRLSPLIVDKISSPQAKYSDWRKLEQTFTNMIQIADICSQFRKDALLFTEIADSVTQSMHVIKYFIDVTIDFESTQSRNRFVLKLGVDPLYDELIFCNKDLSRILNEYGSKDLAILPDNVETYLMVYIPNIQYLLAITKWNGSPPENPEIPGLEYKFTIEGVHHYKSPAALELDEKIGDIKVKIVRRQNIIMMKLVKFIVRRLAEINNVIRLCAELDVLLSFYIVAHNGNYVKPNLVKSKIIAIKQGRHPLKEALVTSFVPNDIYSGEEYSLVKIITGPNASGKSIYLKQIALIVFMAHIGSYVPADSATIGLVTRIGTQILSTDSLSLLNASTFLQDLRQINSILYSAKSDSLVIIDEFGRGTSEIDGSALFASVLSYFIKRGQECPHIFAATHLHRIFDLIPRGPLVKMQTLEFVPPTDEKKIVFLYEIKEGFSRMSYAHAVAKHAGLNPDVIKRATEIHEMKKRNIVPERFDNSTRKNTSPLIVQRLLNSNTAVDMRELKIWVMDIIGINEKFFEEK